MSITLYGIKACDTMKKARTWLDEQGVSYAFHDYKAVGIDQAHLQKWCAEHGCTSHQQQKYWSQTHGARADDVLRDLPHQWHAGGQPLTY